MSKEYDKGAFAGMILGGLIVLVLCLSWAYFTGGADQTLIRENERCLYDNEKLNNANILLLEELGETVIDWEEVE